MARWGLEIWRARHILEPTWDGVASPSHVVCIIRSKQHARRKLSKESLSTAFWRNAFRRYLMRGDIHQDLTNRVTGNALEWLKAAWKNAYLGFIDIRSTWPETYSQRHPPWSNVIIPFGSHTHDRLPRLPQPARLSWGLGNDLGVHSCCTHGGATVVWLAGIRQMEIPAKGNRTPKPATPTIVTRGRFVSPASMQHPEITVRSASETTPIYCYKNCLNRWRDGQIDWYAARKDRGKATWFRWVNQRLSKAFNYVNPHHILNPYTFKGICDTQINMWYNINWSIIPVHISRLPRPVRLQCASQIHARYTESMQSERMLGGMFNPQSVNCVWSVSRVGLGEGIRGWGWGWGPNSPPPPRYIT